MTRRSKIAAATAAVAGIVTVGAGVLVARRDVTRIDSALVDVATGVTERPPEVPGPPYIVERETTRGYVFIVWLDTKRKTREGKPDPAWIVTWTWGKDPPPGVPADGYRVQLRREVDLLVADARRRRGLP